MAHWAAQLLLIKMEDVQPRNKEPDPNRPMKVAGSEPPYEGSRIRTALQRNPDPNQPAEVPGSEEVYARSQIREGP